MLSTLIDITISSRVSAPAGRNPQVKGLRLVGKEARKLCRLCVQFGQDFTVQPAGDDFA